MVRIREVTGKGRWPGYHSEESQAAAADPSLRGVPHLRHFQGQKSTKPGFLPGWELVIRPEDGGMREKREGIHQART